MYKRILIPVDGSSTSDTALSQALTFAQEAGARVRFVHVMDAGAFFGGFDPYGTFTADLLGVMREGGMKVLDRAMAAARAMDIEADYALSEDPRLRLGEAVRDAALRWNADLVALGSHGRRGVGRVMLGSGAEDIARQAPVPVLIIRGNATAADQG